MRIYILVPVYDEDQVFDKWLPSLLNTVQKCDAQVVVVDDGSQKSLEKYQEHESVIVLRHEVNCGVGAALETGLEYARGRAADYVFTIDGDGQHDPDDLLYLLDELKKGAVDIANGSRFLKKQSIPVFRRLANLLGNIIVFLLSGYWLSDSQSGMKGFSKKALRSVSIHSNGYEWCSDVFRMANWNRLKIEELPISVHYDSYTMKKGQGFAVGLDMLVKLMVKSLMR